ncbi:Ankyrin repeat domain-containing protein 29 [Liparis tanakae]|uniref:Ankyrin repeat domain-containing protein 29 n=1 Tax=Liparis tanakae TaxID=230148 RepID=A0A4Z2FMB9_9TELE|nr:Ankyrin repeat domain-containing protein 29 [Liparis tanakae]
MCGSAAGGCCVYFAPQKETPLANAVFWAARSGNAALLQLLLNSGRVDADCRDSVGPAACPGCAARFSPITRLG